MKDPLASIGNRVTATQRERAREDQVANNEGAFVFEITDESKLLRFLILGTTGGTYYQGEREMTVEVTREITAVATRLGPRFVEILREVSVAGRAPKQQPTLWCLALAATATHADGSPNAEMRTAAYGAVKDICRTGTMLFDFVRYSRNFRGGNGRGFRTAVANWYNERPIDRLERQVAKYGQRNGFSHRDVLRLAHPKPSDAAHAELYAWITGKDAPEPKGFVPAEGAKGGLSLIGAAERAKRSDDTAEIIELIKTHGLEREMINSAALKDPKVWEALLPNMGITAIMRNLGAMTACGLITSGSDAERAVIAILGDTEKVERSRVHPMNVLTALHTYSGGRALKGSLEWNATRRITDALDEMFYTAFGNVTPSNTNPCLALDVSASMTWARNAIPGSPLSPRVASAAMALITARTEPDYEIVAFSASRKGDSWLRGHFGIETLNIGPRQRLDDVIKTIEGLWAGGTDCALPFLWAKENKLRFGSFAVYTDNETHSGATHPYEALKQYRQATGLAARSAVVGMTATPFSIADPRDPGMLDVVGFDSAAPQLISDFWSGKV